LINNATKECSTNPTHKAHLIWSNKHTTPLMELQNSCREVVMYYRVLASWFRTCSTLVQTYTYKSTFSLFVTVSPCVQTTYAYDVSIIIIRSQAQGCLTTKNPMQCQAMHTLCALRSPHAVQGCMLAGGMLFRVDFLLLFIAFVNYFLLLKGGNVCYFRVFFFIVQGEGVHLYICSSQTSLSNVLVLILI